MFNSKSLTQWQLMFSFLMLALFAPMVIAAPKITSFGVDQVDSLVPGTDLDFTLSGTPKSRAKIKITGVLRVIPLKETTRGNYEGTYTVSRKDRIAANTAVIATLSKGNSHTLARLGQNLVTASAPVPTPAPQASSVVIERFTSNPNERLEPGTELIFTMQGTPNGRALFTIDNIVTNRRMQEVSPGVYKGRYTIRRQDNFPSVLQVSATLQANGQIARTQLDQRIVNDNTPHTGSRPQIGNVSPRDNESVPYSNNFTVTGNFSDDHHKGIDPKSVQILFDGRDVTGQSSITSQNFSYRPVNLAAGNHTVEVRARDYDGTVSRTNWNFRMLDAAPIAGFPLDILQPQNNAEIGSGPIEVRGRTLPNASVQVDVTAGIFGLNQRIYENTVVADRQGYFSFSFQPQIKVPGARYEVSVRATRDNEMRERKITLIQQR